ncbi:MAG: carbohydrate binding domain-containing protein, partial [Prevotella sp.]|nr:carbohydrate binding domain-containing protein [Prevotella sp.]
MRTKQLLLALLLSLIGIHVAEAESYTPVKGGKIVTDDGIYIVTGDNIIPNSDFSNGLTGWKAGDNSDLSADNFEIIPDGGPDGGPCIHALGGAGSSSNQTIKTGWAIESGKTYVFTVWAYRTQSGMSSNTQYSQVWQSNSETEANTEIGKIKYQADTWVQSQFVFTAEKRYFVAKFAWLNKASSFAHFFLAEVEKSNELVTTSLEASIATAQETLDTTEEGDEKGQYTTAVRKTLSDAIAAAKNVLDTATTQDEINDAKKALDAAVKTYTASKNPPFKLGVGYTITNVAGSLSLTSGDGTVRIATPDFADSTQVFYFEKAPEGAEAVGYNMRDANGTYIWRSGSWDTKSGETTLTAKNAIFNIVEYDTFVQIKNEGSGSVLGVDKTTNNSEVYSNKGGTSSKNCWILVKHTPTAALESAIEKAEDVASSAEVGTEYYQVPQSALDELNAAITTAKDALLTITTPDEAKVAVAALEAAIVKFNGSFNPLPDFANGETYTVTHYGGCLLTTTESGNATITTKEETGASDEQLMVLEKATYQDMTDVYYVKSVANGSYLVRDGNYNTKWRADRDTLAAIIQVCRLEGKWLGMKFVSTSTFLGVDGQGSGSKTYSDKAGVGNTGAYWTIDGYVAIVLDRVAFNEAVAKAQAALAAMVPGYKTGEYFQEDIDEFSKVISKAKTDGNKSKSQEELDAVTAQLLADIDVYVAKAHDRDYLNVTALKAEVDKAKATLDKSVAGDCNGQFPQEAIDKFDAAYKAASAILADENATQEQIDEATETLKAAAAEFAAAKVVIDFSELNFAITEAQTIVKDKADFVGEGPGRYSPEKYEALKTAIA